MAEIHFYTNPMSRGRIARWMLEETGIEYDTTVLEYGRGMNSPDYLALNPMGKVPTIVHGETVVTECAAICAYLADAFPEAGLAPPPAERGAYYRWLFFAAGPLEAAVTNKSMGFATDDPKKQGMLGYGSFERTQKAFAQGLGKALEAGGYIAGPEFTAADVYVGAQVGWGLRFGTLDELPEFAQYWEKVSARDAHKRAGDKDNALIPADAG